MPNRRTIWVVAGLMSMFVALSVARGQERRAGERSAKPAATRSADDPQPPSARDGGGSAKGSSDTEAAPPADAANDGATKVAGTIGYVDLDRVSAQINWKSEFDNDLRAAQSEAARQLTVYRDAVLVALEAKKKEVAAAAHLNADQAKALKSMNGTEFQKLPLTQAQKDDLALSYYQVNQALGAAQQKANQMVNEREQRVLAAFREAMKPAVRRAATAAHLTMVIAPPPNSNPIFWYDPSVDITDQVVDDMRKAMPQPSMPEMPKLNLPTEFYFSADRNGHPQPPAPAAGPGASPASP